MASILQSLNDGWSALAATPAARRAVMRWSATHPVFARAEHLDDVLELGQCPQQGPAVRRTLAALAPTDDLAARTLLQALLGGLTNLACRIGRDAYAIAVVGLAW